MKVSFDKCEHTTNPPLRDSLHHPQLTPLIHHIHTSDEQRKHIFALTQDAIQQRDQLALYSLILTFPIEFHLLSVPMTGEKGKSLGELVNENRKRVSIIPVYHHIIQALRKRFKGVVWDGGEMIVRMEWSVSMGELIELSKHPSFSTIPEVIELARTNAWKDILQVIRQSYIDFETNSFPTLRTLHEVVSAYFQGKDNVKSVKDTVMARGGSLYVRQIFNRGEAGGKVKGVWIEVARRVWNGAVLVREGMWPTARSEQERVLELIPWEVGRVERNEGIVREWD